jgi:hypothetical protein
VAVFIASQRADHGIPQAVSCRALAVSESWFYKWKGGTLPLRAQRRARLAAEVKRLFEEYGGKRGSPMITADLQDAGWRVSKNTVAALLAEQGLLARPRPGQSGLPGAQAEPEVVWRWHRNSHR